MKSLPPIFKKVLSALFSTRAAGVYLILFAAAIGIATFIENDYGTSAAQKVIFQAWWFEGLLVLFAGSIIVNIVKFRMVQQRKWALLLFHSAIIVILVGAAVTRYWGYEGIMHIREQDTSSQFLSRDTYLKFQATKGGQTFDFVEPVLFASLGNNDWSASYLLGNDLIEVEVTEFIPNPVQAFTESLTGVPMLKIVIAGVGGREEYFLEEGQVRRFRNVLYNFTDQVMPEAINIRYREERLELMASRMLTQMVMATQERDTLPSNGTYHPLRLRSLYTEGENRFVFADFQARATTRIESEDPKVRNESITALKMQVSINGQNSETYVYGRKGSPGKPAVVNEGNLQLSIAYGAQEIELPFSIRLYDFVMDKYPGTNSAASYASEVQLIDPTQGIQEDYRIYMNNILNYKGYRFFQSSFDKDERGTYLSVNHDFWGSLISYLGYGLLTLGMLMTFFSRRTRFHQVRKRLKGMRTQVGSIGLIMLLTTGSSIAHAKETAGATQNAVSAEHASIFSRLVVQDIKGRMKPMHTLSREILRKVSRTEQIENFTADQVLLSLFADSKNWYGVPMIKLGKHPDVQKLIGVSGKYAAYRDFFTEEGAYILGKEMRRIHSLAPIDRGAYEKDLLKIDERVNILNMAFSGSLLKIIPRPGDPNNAWIANHSHRHGGSHAHEASTADKFFEAYKKALQNALQTGDYRDADALVEQVQALQQKNGGMILPTPTQLNAEIMLNESRVFSRLMGLYMLLGMGFLGLLFTSVFKPDWNLKMPYRILFGLAATGFVMHTVGLGLRWYVSGRAPWSNGYESMIYIAWTTALAGMLFTRKSVGGLAATMVLAGTILFVATLSFLDPEITPLVPVLRSYWLTIHVSLEAGSYGFLMLGAIMGLINLSLISMMRASNQQRVNRIVQEMSYLSELTLISGLFMISVGTFLGGVWANESWGRYWGWDAKETWALVTILVYAFILHMRIIPKVFSLFTYNLATIFGLASVIMTYYGVNYYLSGLHSYASGDPVPIPSWVYVAVAAISAIGLLAYWKQRTYPLKVRA